MRPRDQRVQDTVVSLQDPKVNVCGRLKGRAPNIEIFGKAGKLIESVSSGYPRPKVLVFEDICAV